ncbi:MAG: hypothetical protein AB7N76_31955 [Planctomycetota bacterium]
MSAVLGDGLLGVALLSARSAVRSWLVRSAAIALVTAPLLLAPTTDGDGTPVGRMRAYLALAGGCASLVLALVAVFLPARLARDLGRGQLTQAVIAPVPRPVLVVAWWLGTSAVLAVLVALAYAALGLGTQGVLFTLKSDAERAEARVVLAARGVAEAERPDEDVFVRAGQEQLTKLVTEGRLPEGVAPEEALQRLIEAAELRSRSLPRGARRGWKVRGLSGVRPDGGPLALRFRFQARRTTPADPGKEGVPLLLLVGDREKQGVYEPIQRHELPVPAEAVAGQDEVLVGVQNLARDDVVVIFPREGPALLYPAGGLTQNLVRAAWVELLRLCFLVAVGVAAAAVLDAKLASLCVLFVLALGYGQGFLQDSLKPGLFGPLDAPVLALLRAVLWVLPDLGRAELSALLAGGELVSDDLLAAGFLDVLVRGGIVLGLGAFLFQGRELGVGRER